MSKINLEQFISEYRKFYFKPDEKSHEYNDFVYKKNKLGLGTVDGTPDELESDIMENELKNGIYNRRAFAWKNGNAVWYEKFEYKSDELRVNRNLLKIPNGKNDKNPKGIPVTQEAFDNLLKSFNNKRAKDNEYDFKTFYKEISDNFNLNGFGPVQIYNMMFFLSKGAFPIYDHFAHRAVRALFEDVSPTEIFLGEPNGSKDNEVMYKEYKRLLYKVFGEAELKENVVESEYQIPGMMISRELDQALWVYGHATEKYEIN